MSVTIIQANEAKTALLWRFGPVLESCIIVLTDKGFVIEAKLRGDVTAQLPEQMNGVPVVSL